MSPSKEFEKLAREIVHVLAQTLDKEGQHTHAAQMVEGWANSTLTPDRRFVEILRIYTVVARRSRNQEILDIVVGINGLLQKGYVTMGELTDFNRSVKEILAEDSFGDHYKLLNEPMRFRKYEGGK